LIASRSARITSYFVADETINDFGNLFNYRLCFSCWAVRIAALKSNMGSRNSTRTLVQVQLAPLDVSDAGSCDLIRDPITHFTRTERTAEFRRDLFLA